jgi:Transposase domain (DUF772)
LRIVGGGAPTLWESRSCRRRCLGIPGEVERVDRLLEDRRIVEPYRAFFHATLGRPSIPIETYLRLMFLKFRYRLSFESLCREVADSISWQRFCRIPLGGRVPHPTTSMKIAKAAEAKVLRRADLRAGGTVRLWEDHDAEDDHRLVEPTSGRIFLDAEDVTGADPVRLRIGYVIQQISLFPHQTISTNVGTVPRAHS